MRKLSFLAALLLLVAPVARAANPDLKRALKLYDDLDYMPALDALQAADARPGSTRKEKVEIQIYIGMISIALGDEAKARKAFAKAISLDRKAKAPAGASPKVATILDQLRAEAPVAAPPTESQPQPAAGGGTQPEQAPAQPQQPAANPYAQSAYPPANPYAPANPYPYGSPYYAQPPAQQSPPPQQAPPYAPPPQQASPPQQAAPYASPPQQSAPYGSTPDQTSTATTVTPAPSGSSNTWSAVTGFSALIVGLAGVGAGVYFQVQTNQEVSDGNSQPAAGLALADQNSANQNWTYTLIGYVAGGVLVVGGLTLIIVHYATGSSQPAEVHAGEVSLTPRGVALSF